VVSQVCAGRYGAGRVRVGSARRAEKLVGSSPGGAAVGMEEEEIARVSRHYSLVLPSLESACVALSGTRIVGLSGCPVSVANLARSRHQCNPLNIKAKRVG